MEISAKDPIIAAIISDMSKMMFKIENLENQVAELGIKEVAAAPAPGPTEPEDLPGMNDLDEFKPDSFEGDAPRVPAAKEPPKLDEGDPFANETEISEEAAKDLQDMIDEDAAAEEELDDEAQEGHGFYDCPSCNSVACINRTMKRCPICQNILDWSDEE